MTVREGIEFVTQYPEIVGILLGVPPVASFVVGLFHGKDNGGKAPWRYLYSLFVYVACIPGMFAAVITAYVLFFSGENLLDMNVLSTLAPIASMVLTLVLVGRRADFDLLPGFDRLWGLMVMIAITFGLALLISKTRIWVVFGGSMMMLFVLLGGIFALLKWGTYMAFRRRHEPKIDPPKFPSP